MRISDWSSYVCTSVLARLVDQAEDGKAGDGLAASRLAHEAQHLALADAERHAVDRLHHAFAGEEVCREVPDLQGRSGHRFNPSSLKARVQDVAQPVGSEEHTSELQSLMRISYAVLCLKK